VQLRPDPSTRADPDARRKRRERRRRRAEAGAPEGLGYVVVVTYGRSGSTLLQGILNSVPGYLVRGENRQILRHLYDFHKTGVEQRQRSRRRQRKHGLEVGASTPDRPFFGMDGFDAAASLRDARRLALSTILRPEPGTRVVGFKEIRWDHEDLEDYVEWLRVLLPGARFVINTRDLEAVSVSKWWAEMPDAVDRLAANEKRLLRLADGLGEDAHHVHYDDYVADPGALRPLFAWLGEEYDEQRVRAVLDRPHSY